MLGLLEIGIKINNAIEAVWCSKLTIEELKRFEDYVRLQDTLTPLLDPTLYQKHSKDFDKAKKRIELLKPIIQLKKEEKKG